MITETLAFLSRLCYYDGMGNIESYKVNDATLIFTPNRTLIRTKHQLLTITNLDYSSNIKLKKLKKLARAEELKSMNDIISCLYSPRGGQTAYIHPLPRNLYEENDIC